MSEPLLFPSRDWVEVAVRELQKDPSVQAALADFGPVVAGIVIQKGPGLDEDLCVLARLAPGKPFDVSCADDEDELEDQEPDYIGWAPYKLVRELLESAMGGARPDPLQYVLRGQVKLKGDLERLVKHAGKHQGAGLDTLRQIPTRFR